MKPVMNIVSSPLFEKQFKRLARKYPSLIDELEILDVALLENPFLGTPLGRGCHKIRVPIASKGSGKSGGARVITCVRVVKEEIHLLTIYDKSEQESISDKDLKALLKSLNLIG